jgi:hypothetical protein
VVEQTNTSKFIEARKWKRLQEKQPFFRSGYWGGREEVRRNWEVLQSDYGDLKLGSGVIVYKVDKVHLRVEIWEEHELRRAFSPLNALDGLEAYYQICEERGWSFEFVI